MKYIQFCNSLDDAITNSHQKPEVLQINDGTDSKILFTNELDCDDDTEVYVYGNSIPEAYFNTEPLCLAAGTKITMSDGTLKNIEDVVLHDMVKTFNHEIGSLADEQVCIAFKGDRLVKPLVLHFTNNMSLSIVSIHSMLEQSFLKYVRITPHNVATYIGKNFYNATDNRWETLLSYEIDVEPVEYYSIYSNNINCIANGFLTAPDDLDYDLNIYELDANLKADADQLAADIAQYGLLDVESVCSDHPEHWETIYALGKYAYIAIGKGLVTKEYLKRLYHFWD